MHNIHLFIHMNQKKIESGGDESLTCIQLRGESFGADFEATAGNWLDAERPSFEHPDA